MLTALWVIAGIIAGIPFSVVVLVLAWHASVWYRGPAVSLTDAEWERLLAAMTADRHEELQPPG